LSDLDLAALSASLAGAARPGEQLEVYVARGRSTSVKAYEGEVESFTSAESAGVGIRVVQDHRVGFASAGSLDPDVVAEVLADARDNAAFAEVDEWAGVAEPDGVDPIPIDLWRDAMAATPETDKVELALALERAVKGADPRIAGVRTAAYGDAIGEAAVATSTGIAVSSRSSFCHLSAVAIARSGDETQVGGGVDLGREPSELDLGRAAGDAVDRATRLLGARRIPSQRLAVVFDPRMAATVLGIVAGTLTGGPVVKGRSPFAEREGEAIASPALTLVDDPTDHRSMGADSHDGEGLACRRNVLVDGGVLRGFLLDTYTGRRLGRPSTGSAVRSSRTTPSAGVQALAVVPGTRSQAELLAGFDTALLVQGMTGLHSGVNTVSGDFSVGVEGILHRDGEPVGPVREVTLGSTLQRILLDVTEVGADPEWTPGGTGTASLAVAEMALGGT
jgi:PmbA protein